MMSLPPAGGLALFGSGTWIRTTVLNSTSLVIELRAVAADGSGGQAALVAAFNLGSGILEKLEQPVVAFDLLRTILTDHGH